MSNSNNLEIERKFLIKYPEFESLAFERRIEISQIYLVRKNPEVERRIRSWGEDGTTKYYYTEKVFLTKCTRQEVESEITKSEYETLKLEKDNSIVTVEKVRYNVESNGLTFEIDVYPFSKNYAIMEVELENESQEYTIPHGVEVVREVTGINEYANISLCTAQKFPNEYI